MSSASDALATYLKSYVKDINTHYQWSFNEERAERITGRDYADYDGWYTKTLSLKNDLRGSLASTKDPERRFEIARYFIEEWGGVGANKELRVTIDNFSDRLAHGKDDFREIPLKGVSSWSKYITLCSNWAAIYDSRVAYSINAIRYMAGDTDRFFPIPEGRSPRLSLIDVETLFILSSLEKGTLNLDEDLKHKHFSSRTRKRFHVDEKATYHSYLKLLDETTEGLNLPGNEFSKVEMLLFALAPTQVLSDLIKHISKHPRDLIDQNTASSNPSVGTI